MSGDLKYQPWRSRPVSGGNSIRISVLLDGLCSLATLMLRPGAFLGARDTLDLLMSDLRASDGRAADLGVPLDAAAMLVVALTHVADAPAENDDGRWGLLAEQLGHFVQADMRRAGELELKQMSERS